MEANEARQMEMLLQEGGIADDGTTVDPVSGNDVPPGSMAEEVRDDIPAQLSEGEYVVPADVARYYGVKFFEDLRNEAKRGLAQMETDGRIGGEPVNQTMDNQAEGALTPEELAMLQEMGMAVGGMVPPADTEGYNKDGQVLYAAEGTDVSTKKDIDPNKPQFTAAMGPAFGGGFLSQSILNESTAPTSTTVTLYSPEGIGRALILPAEGDLYDKLRSEGYTTDQVAPTTDTSIGKEAPDGGGRADQGYGDGEGGEPSVAISDMKDEQLASSAKALGIVGTLGKIALGPIASTALGTVTAARYNDILDEMTTRGMDTEGMSRKGSIFGGEKGLFSGLSDVNDDGKTNFGDTFLGDLLGFDGKFGIQEGRPGLGASWRGDRRDATASPTSAPAVTADKGVQNDTPQGPTAAQEAMGEEEGKIGLDAFGDAVAAPQGPTAAQEAMGEAEAEIGIDAFGGMNEGGLIKRPKKNKKRKK